MGRVPSYQGKLLRVNLTTRESKVEPIPERDLELFLGGRGLGVSYLFREVRAGTDPLGPDNVLMFCTGPLTSTGCTGTAKYVVVTKSPLTGTMLLTVSSRQFGPELKKCGYDMLLIEGRATDPCYLYINDDQVEIRDAGLVWGLNTDLAERYLHQEHGGRAAIATIGPAGEKLVRYAAIINDGRAAARGGAGAVMGSKNLKAVVVRGSKQPEPFDKDALREAMRALAEEVENLPVTKKSFRPYGTLGTGVLMNEVGVMPVRNWQRTYEPKIADLGGDVMREKFWLRDTNCPPCSVWCIKECVVKEGPYAGAISEGPEYETVYSLGSCIEVYDLGAVIDADSICDRLGLDSMSAGLVVSFAMECFERGILSAKDTGGVELKFGDYTPIPALLRDIAQRRGFGDFLAEGVMRMAAEIGNGSDRFAMHVKGMELGGYDPRGVKGMALCYACGPRGGCHHAGGRTIAEEIQSGKMDRLALEGKAEVVKMTRDKQCYRDSVVICNFNRVSDEALSKLLAAATGRNLSVAELQQIGDRISNLERAFNCREGFRREHDTLPARLLEEQLPDGPSAGQVVDLNYLLDDYYQLCGWDVSTGIPTPQKLREMELDQIIGDLG
ncbi:MAG: aldehyde ferredoxin oxidoreductase family protein [Firmicutes bacterium]|nr:aldehyde ferredoxin oxidoreductase family protein [Bacillota bacterium]